MTVRIIATIAAGLIAIGVSIGADAEVRTKTFYYKQASTTLEGYIAWDDAVKGKRPGVLVFPTYTGPSEFERDVARKLAKLGYVAIVADIYGATPFLTQALCSRESTFPTRRRSRIITLSFGRRLAILGTFSATSRWGAAIVIPPSERTLAWIVRAPGLLRRTANLLLT